jgi:hypothetical protein
MEATVAHPTHAVDRPPTVADPRTTNGFVFGRDIGPVGRLFRLVFVLIAIASLSSRIAKQLHGVEYLWMTMFVLLIFAGYLAFFWAMNRWLFDRVSPWTAAAMLLVPVLAYPLQLGPPTFHNAIAVYTTISALLCPIIGYGGLEVVSLPALLLRTRPVLYSPFNTVDVSERAFGARAAGRGALWVLSIAVTAFCLIDYWYATLLLTVPAVDRNVSHGIELPVTVALLLLLPAGYLAVRARSLRGAPDARLLAMAAGCIGVLMLIFLGKQVPDHTLWGVILVVGLVTAVVRLFRRSPAPALPIQQ